MIRNCLIRDARTLCDIYNYYIENTTITFEESLLTQADIEERIKAVQSKGFPWIVFEENSEVIGYAYAGEFKSRCAYRMTCETSLYISCKHTGKGIGSTLYKELIQRSKTQGIHSLIGIIAIPNDRSVKLHKDLGFEKAGRLREAGYKFDKWIDVEYYQLML